jgi:hypothetical protein
MVGDVRERERRATTGVARRQALGWAGLRHAKKEFASSLASNPSTYYQTTGQTTGQTIARLSGRKTPLCHKFPISSPYTRRDSHLKSCHAELPPSYGLSCTSRAVPCSLVYPCVTPQPRVQPVASTAMLSMCSMCSCVSGHVIE